MSKKVVHLDDYADHGDFEYSNSSRKSSAQLVSILNGLSQGQAEAYLAEKRIQVPIQEMFDFELVYIDTKSNTVYKDPGQPGYSVAPLEVLTYYQRSKCFLDRFVDQIDDLPAFKEMGFIFYNAVSNHENCLICPIGTKELFYAILRPVEADLRPQKDDTHFRWEIYRSDLEEFFFADQGEYDLDECIARIKMGEMLASHRL